MAILYRGLRTRRVVNVGEKAECSSRLSWHSVRSQWSASVATRGRRAVWAGSPGRNCRNLQMLLIVMFPSVVSLVQSVTPTDAVVYGRLELVLGDVSHQFIAARSFDLVLSYPIVTGVHELLETCVLAGVAVSNPLGLSVQLREHNAIA